MEDKDVIDLDSQINEANNTNHGFGGKPKLPNASAVLVLGIISIATCWLYGIPGLVCGIIALFLSKKDKALYASHPNKYDESSYKNLNAGFVCAIIGTSLSGLVVLYLIFVMFILATIASSAAGNAGAFQELLEQSREYDNY